MSRCEVEMSLDGLRARRVALCRLQIGLGRDDAALRLMGFAEGCIREARCLLAPEVERVAAASGSGGVRHD